MKFQWIEVAPVRGEPQNWMTYAVDEEGAIFVAIFEGPDAQARAEEYATFKYGSWTYGKNWNAA